MRSLLTTFWISQMLFCVAKLRSPTRWSRSPSLRTQSRSASARSAVPAPRAARSLASVGVFAEDVRGRFRLTPLAQTLRADRPDSLRDFALMIADDYHWKAWGGLPTASKRARTRSADARHATFAFLQQHPEKERAFAASMASVSGTENAAVARAYAFGRFARLVDVGGAHGHLLATILRRSKKLRGVLYDQPQVVAGAKASGFVDAPDVRERIEVAGGSFFESVPSGADGYLMKYIIHDWDDEKAMRILGHCRDAMTPEGRVLVVDHVIPQGNSPNWAKLLDVNMLALLTGRERTLEQFRALFRSAGLKLRRAHATKSALRILEAVAD
jgi:hypothetical protein